MKIFSSYLFISKNFFLSFPGNFLIISTYNVSGDKMIIKQEELEKICLNLYPYFFDYKDITLHDINIKIDDYLHVKANLNYYNIETKIKAIARVVVKDQIIINFDGIVKYGFINLDLKKVLTELIKDNPYLQIEPDCIKIANDYIKEITLEDGLVKIELK